MPTVFGQVAPGFEEVCVEKLDKYRLLILDDLSYVQKSQAETSVLFVQGGDKTSHWNGGVVLSVAV